MRALDLARLLATGTTARTGPQTETPTGTSAGTGGQPAPATGTVPLLQAATRRAWDLTRRARRELPGRVAARTDEPSLATFFTSYVEDRETHAADGSFHAVRFALRNPVTTAAAVGAVLRLPVVPARLGNDPAGEVLRSTLGAKHLGGLSVAATGVACLDVPADAGDYVLGANRQTLRRKVRAAQKKGVRFRFVDDLEERRRLVERANAAEQAHADLRYRNGVPDNSDLLLHDLWIVATDADDEPIMLSVTPVDGRWGLLRYFRTLGASPAHSDARYLLMPVLVEALAARGVRHLIDTTPPAHLPNGLRHFQRMVGYRYTRVKVLPR